MAPGVGYSRHGVLQARRADSLPERHASPGAAWDTRHSRGERALEESGPGAERDSFQMPDEIENGVGATWQGGPFGPVPQCPSSAKVLQMGVAVDAGYLKVSTRPPACRCPTLSSGALLLFRRNSGRAPGERRLNRPARKPGRGMAIRPMSSAKPIKSALCWYDRSLWRLFEAVGF